MTNKLKMWDGQKSWEKAEKQWDEGAALAEREAPIKKLKKIPSMVGITPDTKRFLKGKSLLWMIKEDRNHAIKKELLSKPFTYFFAYLKSLIRRKSYTKKEGDFYYYGVEDLNSFTSLLDREDTLFVVGFSYCHKPFECPSGRFTDQCIHDLENPVCRQCFIGKMVHALPAKNVVPLFIPTVHYVAEQILKLIRLNPDKQVIFMITACEMTLEMFGDWGNMAGIKGIGVRLDGRICNTMNAFKLSEKGIKPGLTVVLPETAKSMLEIIRRRQEKHG